MSSTPGSVGTNFTMATEDFPALPGVPSGPSGSNGSSGSGLVSGLEAGQRDMVSGPSTPGSAFGSSTQQQQHSRNPLGGGGMFGGDLESLAKQLDSSSLVGSGSMGIGNLIGLQSSANPGLSLQQRSGGAPAAGGGQGPTAGSALSGDFGLLGLLSVIRMTDADRNALALGSDLTMLGLNLNSSDNLYSTFASPWSDSPTTREPQYQVSQLYNFNTRMNV